MKYYLLVGFIIWVVNWIVEINRKHIFNDIVNKDLEDLGIVPKTILTTICNMVCSIFLYPITLPMGLLIGWYIADARCKEIEAEIEALTRTTEA